MQTKLIPAFLALCPFVFSQSPEKPQAAPEVPGIVKMIRVHSDPGTIVGLLRPGSYRTSIQGDSGLRVIVLNGPPAEIAALERTIHDLDALGDTDARGKNVESVFYLLGGSMEPADGRPEPEIAALAPVYKQLRAIFPFKSYRLLSTMLMRSSEDKLTHAEGTMKPLQTSPDFSGPAGYTIQYSKASSSGDGPPMIHLENLAFTVSNTFQHQQSIIGINTSVDVREGQKVIVGTSNVEPTGTTIFLVVTAKVL